MTTVKRIRGLVRERRLNLNPPLPLKAVVEFERCNGIALPSDYRDFVLHVGNGGDGPPEYGLLSLGDTPRNEVPHWFSSGYSDLLAKPFPLTHYWAWEDDEETAELEASILALRQGNLCLGTDGSGMYWLLIVTGQERGQVWNLADVGAQPLAPRLTFLRWYEYWLSGGDDWYRDFAP